MPCHAASQQNRLFPRGCLGGGRSVSVVAVVRSPLGVLAAAMLGVCPPHLRPEHPEQPNDCTIQIVPGPWEPPGKKNERPLRPGLGTHR